MTDDVHTANTHGHSNVDPDPTAGIRAVKPRTRYLISSPDLRTASQLAARADLSLRDWSWIETTDGDPGIFEKLTHEQVQALAPPRWPWET